MAPPPLEKVPFTVAPPSLPTITAHNADSLAVDGYSSQPAIVISVPSKASTKPQSSSSPSLAPLSLKQGADGLTLAELDRLVNKFAPLIYFHPQEKFLPASVSWYLDRATLHSAEGDVILPPLRKLPEGGGIDDRLHWLQLEQKYWGGNLESAELYVRVKKCVPGTIDLQYWVFLPFNGGGTLKLGFPVGAPKLKDIRPFGQHQGDWEHITVRVDESTHKALKVYYAAHAKGEWHAEGTYPTADTTRPVAYASLNGHALYTSIGENLTSSASHGVFSIGLVNATDKGPKLDGLGRLKLVSVMDGVLREDEQPVIEPFWTQYLRHWGPRIVYTEEYLQEVLSGLGVPVPSFVLRSVVARLPKSAKNELEEDGATGPMGKAHWVGDERS